MKLFIISENIFPAKIYWKFLGVSASLQEETPFVKINSSFGFFQFLVATKQLYKRVCPSFGSSVSPLVHLSVFPSAMRNATYPVCTTLFREQGP